VDDFEELEDATSLATVTYCEQHWRRGIIKAADSVLPSPGDAPLGMSQSQEWNGEQWPKNFRGEWQLPSRWFQALASPSGI